MSPAPDPSRHLQAVLTAVVCLLVLILATLSRPVAARIVDGDSPQAVWTDVDESAIQGHGRRLIVPDRYRTVAADLPALRAILSAAPLEFTPAAETQAVLLSLPLPDGRSSRFRLYESPVMAPPLAARYPEVRTYTALGIDDVHAYGRLDLTPNGFHALVFSPDGTFYIDPYRQGDPAYYVSYFTRDYSNSSPYVEQPPIGDPAEIEALVAGLKSQVGSLSVGEQLRTYRLALATTGEYSIYHGGTVPLVMAELVTAVNRVTGVYEREVAVRMELIPNNDLVVFLDPNTDPYTNNNGGLMLQQNITTLNAIIGFANYDIGHVFSTGGGGVAYLNAVCGANKAGGVTGGSNPIGDPFYIDYVAHEMGHQYGATHTFNGNAGACVGNRTGSTAYEPGSGTTIMAYAGICGSQDIQPNSDDYFHGASFDQIVAYTTAGQGSTCAAVTATGNNPPLVDAGAGGFTIPRQTSFVLTGTGSDPNGHPITYNWEEFDLGPAGHPNNPVSNAPIFRSFPAAGSPARTFPQFSDLLNNTQTIGEILPTYTRSLTFRLTVRDNQASPGAGGVAYDTVAFSVTDQAGPFLVTAPNTPLTWDIGTAQPVTWDVADSNLSPVNCPAVDVTLSTDGGYTYPHTLAAATANDGAQQAVVPNAPTTMARVRVQCSSNIFFDVSNANFTIAAGVPYAALTVGKTVVPGGVLAPGDPLTYTIIVTNSGNLAADTTVTDVFPAAVANPVCDGVPGDLSVNVLVPGPGSAAFVCTAGVEPGLAVQLTKTADQTSVVANTAVTYTIVVLNPNANLVLTNVVVSDPDAANCAPDLGVPITLGPLDGQSYICPDNVITETTTNTASVTAETSFSNVATAAAPEDPNSPATSPPITSQVAIQASASVTVTVTAPPVWRLLLPFIGRH